VGNKRNPTHIILGKNVVFTVIMQLRASCFPIRTAERENKVLILEVPNAIHL